LGHRCVEGELQSLPELPPRLEQRRTLTNSELSDSAEEQGAEVEVGEVHARLLGVPKRSNGLDSVSEQGERSREYEPEEK